MVSTRQAAITLSLLGVALGQGVILKAQGARRSPASLSLQVDTNDEVDANFISQTEIVTNVVNECGRTLLAGNIDIGARTEDALADNQVTQVTQGSDVQVTIRQVNETGAGPYTCDMDLTSNSNGAAGQTTLTTSEEEADQDGNIALTVTMPDDLKCIGASTGDVCTVRCRNANEFGGCFAVQQTDTDPNENTPDNIETAASLKDILAQVQQDIVDLPAAIKGIAESGDTEAEQGLAVIEEIQAANPSTNGFLEENQPDASDDVSDDNSNGNSNNNSNNGNSRGSSRAGFRGGFRGNSRNN
ncbi:hypothetical protein F5X99DRAFT_67504 [Biscogniauxia marginata]|nr:hypothetical protein F5X99DRAFT_67504 [Biscogniauxia marginata]